MISYDERDILPDTIPSLLDRYAEDGRVAVICGDETLSYRELLSDGQHIARALVRRGVQKGDRVVMEMSRSTDYIRALLGVMMSGGVRVTVHSGWPERMKDMVAADCDPVMTLNDAGVRALLAEPEEDIPLPALTGEDPFQIVYTSGSTGTPKGVVSCQRTVIDNFISRDRTSGEYYTLRFFEEHCERLLADANTAYILATGQLFIPLVNGKTAVLATEADVTGPGALGRCMLRGGVDTLFGIPSVFARYLEDDDFQKAVSGLRLLVLAGEPASPLVPEIFLRYAPELRICWHYGSTETMCGTMGDRYQRGEETLFIRPEHTNPAFLLRPGGMEETAPGEESELCLGGTVGQLGYYWNDPELNKERYVDHPVYGRLLRTGDLACIEPDGRLRVLGRLDGMAKLFGQRIELSAVETAMMAFPDVKEAAVRVQGEGPKAVLCGFYRGSADPGALRRALAEVLPYYMVPSFLTELSEIPRLTSGKPDRGALPEVQTGAGGFSPPETEAERLLCEAFSRALEKNIGIDDSFFELGGDSIRAMAAAALLREQGWDLKTEWVFAAPSIRALAPMLIPRTRKEEPLWSTELTATEQVRLDGLVNPGNVEAFYPALPMMRDYLRRGDPCWICSAYLMDKSFTMEKLRRNLDRSVRSHQALRTVFAFSDKERPLQLVLRDVEVPIFSEDLRNLAGTEVPSKAQMQYMWTLNRQVQEKPLSEGEIMLRVGMLKVSDTRSVLFVGCSHLLLDAVGIVQLRDELVGGAEAVDDTRAYNLYMRRILSEDYTRNSRRVWQELLADRPGMTVPTAGTGPEKARVRMMAAGSGLTGKISELCGKMRVTVTSLLCLALGRAILSLTGTDEAGFFLSSSGRDADNAGLTGMFTSGFPVWVRKNDTPVTLQERLLREAAAPVIDPDLLGGLEVLDKCVCLSMQNNLRTAEPEDLFRTTAPTGIGLAEAAGVNLSRRLTVIVDPEGAFRIWLLYNEAWVDGAFADGLGRRLLGELRQLTDNLLII